MGARRHRRVERIRRCCFGIRVAVLGVAGDSAVVSSVVTFAASTLGQTILVVGVDLLWTVIASFAWQARPADGPIAELGTQRPGPRGGAADRQWPVVVSLVFSGLYGLVDRLRVARPDVGREEFDFE